VALIDFHGAPPRLISGRLRLHRLSLLGFSVTQSSTYFSLSGHHHTVTRKRETHPYLFAKISILCSCGCFPRHVLFPSYERPSFSHIPNNTKNCSHACVMSVRHDKSIRFCTVQIIKLIVLFQ